MVNFMRSFRLFNLFRFLRALTSEISSSYPSFRIRQLQNGPGLLPMSCSRSRFFVGINDFLFRTFHTELGFLFSLSRPTEWDTTSMMWMVSIVRLHDNYVDLSVF